MKFRKLAIAWLVVAIGLEFGSFRLWAQCQRVVTRTAGDTSAENLRIETDKRELEEQKAATAENESLKAPIAPYVDIATLDVEKVFKKSQKYNAAMAPIRAKLVPYNFPLPENHELKIAQMRVLGETYQCMDKVVTRIGKAGNIGLVIRAKLESFDVTGRSSVLQGVNRPVVYSVVPDLTDEVIAELDR